MYIKVNIIKYLTISVLSVIWSAGVTTGQVSEVSTRLGLAAINESVLKSQLGFLASDWMEGREAGEKGEFLASDYLASMLQLYGVKPGGDYNMTRRVADAQATGERSYFQNFVLLKMVSGNNQQFKVRSSGGTSVKTTDFTYNVDFIVRPYYTPVEIEAPVVFVGYGFKNDRIKFNDFGKTDIKGKFILKIAGIPLIAREKLSQDELTASLRESDAYIREKGAAGIIEFNPSALVVGRPESKDFTDPSPSESYPRSGKPYAIYSIPGEKIANIPIRVIASVKTANEILDGSGIDVGDYRKYADAGQPYLIAPLTSKTIILKTDVSTFQVAVRNVLGMIEGKNPDQIIVLGAHYDHLGTGNGYIWNGADDNGSGTVGVLTLAKALMATGEKPDKTIIFAFWTAEEEGLLGSRYYVNNLAYPVRDIRLNANFDMISRYIANDNPNGVVMTYTGSYPSFKDITVRNLKKYGIDLNVDYQPSDDPPGGTDHRSFVEKGVPVMRFKPGHREEYHTPSDETGTVNWDIMEKIIKISFANIWELSNSNW